MDVQNSLRTQSVSVSTDRERGYILWMDRIGLDSTTRVDWLEAVAISTLARGELQAATKHPPQIPGRAHFDLTRARGWKRLDALPHAVQVFLGHWVT